MRKIGLVLVGGGGRGAYQIGVWKALKETGLDGYVSAVSGTSVGGLNAALYLQQDYERAEKVWKGISPEKILTPRFQKRESADGSVEKSGIYLFKRDGLSKIIDDNLDMRIFDSREENCYMTCVEIGGSKNRDDYEEQYTLPNGTKGCKMYVSEGVTYFNMRAFSYEDRKKILLATSAIPVVFSPIEINGRAYVDGGLKDNLPIEPLVRLEKCNKILVVHLDTSDGMIMNEVRNKFPHTVFLEVRPKKSQGGRVGGMNFCGAAAAKGIEQGYQDSIECFRKVEELIDLGREEKRKEEEKRKIPPQVGEPDCIYEKIEARLK